MQFLLDLQLPVVDGTTLPLPELDYITLFQSANGLSVLYPDGSIELVDTKGDVGDSSAFASVKVYSGRPTDNLLREVIRQLDILNQQVSGLLN